MSDTLIILEYVESSFGRIRIYENPKDGARTFYQDSCFQSEADANGQSLIAYIHAMHGVLVQSGACKVAVLGCAGGTLATMLVASGCEVTMVDINPYSFELAKRYFCLPDEVECVEADARSYLENTRQRFDAIAIDVFDGGHIPLHLRTVEFFRIAASRLTDNGVIVMNAIIDHDLDLLADHVATSIKKATHLPILMFDDMHESDRNIVIAAGPLPTIQLPCGNEPMPIQKELRKLAVRKVRSQAVAFYDAVLIETETDRA